MKKEDKIEQAVAKLQGRKRLFRVWQDVNNDYDTYDSAVICADTPERAKEISCEEFGNWGHSWAPMKDVNAEEIGTAIKDMEEGVIVKSFNAG